MHIDETRRWIWLRASKQSLATLPCGKLDLQATIVTGKVCTIWGIKCVVSTFILDAECVTGCGKLLLLRLQIKIRPPFLPRVSFAVESSERDRWIHAPELGPKRTAFPRRA